VSLDTIAIFDVAAPVEPTTLVERLAVAPSITALEPRFGPMWEPTSWSIEPSSTHAASLDIVGPGGLVLRLGRKSLEVYHVCPFVTFARDDDDRSLLRRAFRTIARLVGAKHAVYTHELAASDRDPELGTAEVMESLEANVGPRAVTFAALAEAKPHRPGSWLVDTFEDLDVN